MKQATWILLSLVVLAAISGDVISRRAAASDQSSADQWEYLVVTSPNTVNFSSPSSSSMRKEPNGGFSREAFVLEQNMDKLGAKGWELVSIINAAPEPSYYFKRRKQSSGN